MIKLKKIFVFLFYFFAFVLAVNSMPINEVKLIYQDLGVENSSKK